MYNNTLLTLLCRNGKKLQFFTPNEPVGRNLRMQLCGSQTSNSNVARSATGEGGGVSFIRHFGMNLSDGALKCEQTYLHI